MYGMRIKPSVDAVRRVCSDGKIRSPSRIGLAVGRNRSCLFARGSLAAPPKIAGAKSEQVEPGERQGPAERKPH